MSNIVDRYRDKFQKSGEMFQLGKNVIPGGGHQSRTVYPYPVYIEKGEGSLKWDVDGNQLIDYMIFYLVSQYFLDISWKRKLSFFF